MLLFYCFLMYVYTKEILFQLYSYLMYTFSDH